MKRHRTCPTKKIIYSDGRSAYDRGLTSLPMFMRKTGLPEKRYMGVYRHIQLRSHTTPQEVFRVVAMDEPREHRRTPIRIPMRLLCPLFGRKYDTYKLHYNKFRRPQRAILFLSGPPPAGPKVVGTDVSVFEVCDALKLSFDVFFHHVDTGQSMCQIFGELPLSGTPLLDVQEAIMSGSIPPGIQEAGRWFRTATSFHRIVAAEHGIPVGRVAKLRAEGKNLAEILSEERLRNGGLLSENYFARHPEKIGLKAWLYAVNTVVGGRQAVKIGVSTDLEARLASLPGTPELNSCIEGGYRNCFRAEQFFLELYRDDFPAGYGQKGGWTESFAFSDRIQKVLKSFFVCAARDVDWCLEQVL